LQLFTFYLFDSAQPGHNSFPSKGYKSIFAAYAVGAFHYLLLSPYFGYSKRNSATKAYFPEVSVIFDPQRCPCLLRFAVGAFHYLLSSPYFGHSKRNSATRVYFVVYFALFSPENVGFHVERACWG
jgi:hypothetical protein